MKQKSKFIGITVMPGNEPKLTVYMYNNWDRENHSVWMKMFLLNEYPAIYLFPCEKKEEASFAINSRSSELTITHPMYTPPALYERLGWTKYMSYRMEVNPSENGEYVFDLKNAAPYAVDDFIEPEEMERLRKELTPMELTKLFWPGATEPYIF